MPNSYAEENDTEIIPNEFVFKVNATKDNINNVAEQLKKDLEEKYNAKVEIVGIYKELSIISVKIKPKLEQQLL